MPIRYALYNNHLTADPNDHTAIVFPVKTIGMGEIIEKIANRGSTVTTADVISVFENFQEALKESLLEGDNVTLPFGNYSLAIKGSFNGKTDSFDPNRHHIAVKVAPGAKLRKITQQEISVHKETANVLKPEVLEFTDINTGEKDSIVTPGGMGQILGTNLKFNTEIADEGIFFIPDTGADAIKVQIIGTLKPSTLLFIIPTELLAGEYFIEVRSIINNEMRIGNYNKELSVS